MKGFETPLAEEPALFASQHHHGDDGGDDGFGHGDDVSDNFREFVAEAEAGLEAGIALARAERAERDEIRKDSLGVRNLRLFLSHFDFFVFLCFFLTFLSFLILTHFSWITRCFGCAPAQFPSPRDTENLNMPLGLLETGSAR